jgi:CDP-paratose 2-epimerase
MYEFAQAPRIAEVYNLGGGKQNSCSILEAFSLVESITGNSMKWSYVDQNRIGDHICYYSDLRKMREHYPKWDITKNLQTTFEEIVAGWRNRKVLVSKA